MKIMANLAGMAVMAAALVGLPGPAFSVEPTREAYLSLYGGLVVPQEADVDFDNGIDSGSGTLEFDNGFSIGAAVGYNWSGPRFEVEISYRSFEASKLKEITLNGVKEPDETGSIDFSLFTVFGNVLYEIATDSPFTPYLGIGLGVGFVEASPSGTTADYIGSGGDDAVFAYQGIIGSKMQLSDGTSAFVDYRYLGTSEVAIEDTSGSLATHNINAGFMFSFSPVTQR